MDVGTKRRDPVAELRTRSSWIGIGVVGRGKKMIQPMDTEIDEPTEERVLSFFFLFFFNGIKSRVLTFSRARPLFIYNLGAFPAYEVEMAHIRGLSLVLLIVRY